MDIDTNVLAPFSRRSFLARAGQVLAGLAIVSVPGIATAAKAQGKRTLSLYHTHTQKELTLTYAWGRTYSTKAMARIQQFLRDPKTGQSHPIDPHLLDILWKLEQEMGRRGTYEVLSGFRSPATNKRLRRNSRGVAKRSLHMEGRAIDIRFPGVDLDQIRECAIEMRTGGVGYYARSQFVHLDTGDFRTW
ncbi:MAG: YcbK family protein [Desulfobulbus sp.]|jgi:uncharacterized protein YcbK (DUF882 family)